MPPLHVLAFTKHSLVFMATVQILKGREPAEQLRAERAAMLAVGVGEVESREDEWERMSQSQIRLKSPRVLFSFIINSNKLFPLNCFFFFNVR